MFKFHKKGISIGEKLISSIDQSVSAVVVDDSHIELAGRHMTLSSGALELMKRKGIERTRFQGTKFWLLNGTAVADLPDVETQGGILPEGQR
jgi:hypothetical protein